MNPVVFGMEPTDIVPFLLIGEMVHYIDRRPSERMWHLNVYSSAKSRQIAMKKLKRGNIDIIYVEWDVTMKQILKEGRLVFPIASDKILRTDKLDILRQLIKSQRARGN
jgi:hypothetical protein